MTHAEKMKNARPIDDLALYELVVAMYPEKFADRDEAGDDLWDEVMEFVQDEIVDELLQDEYGLRALLGRVLLLTHPVRGMLGGELFHALGPVEIKGNEVRLTACAKVEAVREEPAE